MIQFAKRVRATLAFVLVPFLIQPAMPQQPATQQPGGVAAERLWGQPALPQDAGITALYQDIAKLRSTARLMATAAHPDDEDGGMLAMESRGAGATALELTVNRGEGGQNKIGPELFDELGILRTLELLQADQFYGVEERFTRAVDFGFSKTAEETFDKWGGHDLVLADFVRVIRKFRPDVIVSVFSGTSQDGHGNHQASGMLTREAFRAAADPNKFPEQIREGLLPWQAKKLYVGRFFRGNTDCTLELDLGTYSPVLGKSYAQLGSEGRGEQLSQVSSPIVPPGPRPRCYVLVDSTLPTAVPGKAHEKDLFDGIDTSLPGLVSRLGAEDSKAPFLAPALDKLDAAARNAANFGPRDMSMAAPILLGGVNLLRDVIPQVQRSGLSVAAKTDLLAHLNTKLAEFEKAAADAQSLELDAAADAGGSGGGQRGPFVQLEQSFLMAVPGQTFSLTAHLYNRGKQALESAGFKLEVPAGWKVEPIPPTVAGPVPPDGEVSARFRVTVPADAQYSRPYFYRDDPQKESVYRIVPGMEKYETLPFPPPPVIVHAEYLQGEGHGEMRSVVQVRYIDPIYGQAERPLAVGPALSVELQPSSQIISTSKAGATQVRVGVRNNAVGGSEGSLALQVPQGWRVQPTSIPVKFSDAGEYASYAFTVTPGPLREQHYDVKAVVTSNGKPYDLGYRVIARRDIGTFYYYQPARQTVSAVEVKLPSKLRVGYIMGAGDDIAASLEQVGVDVHMISPAELAGGDLSQYDTIVLGIRAYDVRTDVREQNRRLLDYVQRGGTLIAQYNQQTGAFNAGHYTPYPATASGERVTVEEAPVEILDAASPLLSTPNKITQKDFDGWVQERGVYFMSSWDPKYTPLLASHDPGEQPLKGGMLVAQYGKGTYIFTGYAFFRQLPAGVPGAMRLFVNLLAAGAKTK
jgi:LmbE family N-acetylglucosaminyl deacetylase